MVLVALSTICSLRKLRAYEDPHDANLLVYMDTRLAVRSKLAAGAAVLLFSHLGLDDMDMTRKKSTNPHALRCRRLRHVARNP